MNFFNKIFNRNKSYENNPEGFWLWFEDNETAFIKAFDNANKVDSIVVNPIISRLNLIREGFFPTFNYSASGEIEVVFSVNGELKNIVFAENLVKIAPNLKRWKFLALIPAVKTTEFSLEVNTIKYDEKNLFFYAHNDEKYPEDIGITFVHEDFRKIWLHLIVPV